MSIRRRITAIDPSYGAFLTDAAYEVLGTVLSDDGTLNKTLFLTADDAGEFAYISADQCRHSRAGSPAAHR